MSDVKKQDARQLYWADELGQLSEKNRKQVTRAMSRSIRQTLGSLRKSYAKFTESGGTENRYTIESQTARYKELVKASEALLGPATIKQIGEVYKRDLDVAHRLGGTSANDLIKLTSGRDSAVKDLTKMPVAAQIAAGQRLEAFWSKERAELRSKVTEATLNALQRGKGWKGAQAQIADALRSSGQTILRGNDELSRTARGGIVMNLEQRADLIARTELASAYVEGQMRQFRKNGYSHGRWSAAGERTCPFCASREGVIYPLDELDGAIPAHPRCRCSVSPVLGDSLNKVLQSNDKQAAASQWLDDAGWTAIRQQRIQEYLKFSGKPSLDVAKYLRTPTSKERFFRGTDATAIEPSWMPSGKAQPDLKAAAAAASRAVELEKNAKAAEDLEAQRKEAEEARVKEEERKAAEAAKAAAEAAKKPVPQEIKDKGLEAGWGQLSPEQQQKLLSTVRDMIAREAAAKKAAEKAKKQGKALEAKINGSRIEERIGQKVVSPKSGSIQGTDFANALKKLRGQELVGLNVRRLMAFQERYNISTITGTGSESNIDFLLQSRQLLSSLDAAQARKTATNKFGGGNDAAFKNIRDELAAIQEKGSPIYVWTKKHMTVTKTNGVGGSTADGMGAVKVKTSKHHKKMDDAQLKQLQDSVEQSVIKSAQGRPFEVTSELTYTKTIQTKKYSYTASESDWLSNYIHEMGHQIHYAVGQPMPGDKAMKWQPSRYGVTNRQEWFAETFTQYVLAPKTLKRYAPEAYDFIDQQMKRALTGLPGEVGHAVSRGVEPPKRTIDENLVKKAGFRTVADLKAEAKARGLKGYSNLKRPELEALLSGSEPAQPQKPTPAPASAAKPLEGMTVTQLKAEAKKSGLKGYSKLKKGELIEALSKTRSADAPAPTKSETSPVPAPAKPKADGDLEAKKKKLEGDLDRLSRDLDGNSKKQSENDQKIEELKKQIDKLDREQALRKDLDAEKANADLNLKAAQELAKKAEADFDKLKAKKRQLQKEIEEGGGDAAKFDLDAYDSQIATQSHTLSSLKKVGADTLRRAGVDLDAIKDFQGGDVKPLEQSINSAKVKIATYQKRIKASERELKKLEKEWAQNEGYIAETFPTQLELQRKIYEGKKETLQRNIDQLPAAIEKLEASLATNSKQLEQMKKSAGTPPAQLLIDELVRTSPLTKEQALKLVEDAASAAARRDAADKTRHSVRTNLKPVPKVDGLEPMAAAVQMFGTRSSMDVYGFSGDRAWARGRIRSTQTGELLRMNFDGKTLSGLGFINSGGGGARFRQTQFHELGHHIEYSNSDVYRAAREFIAERSVGDKPKWLGKGYGKDEVAWETKRSVISPYALKEYDLKRLKFARPEHKEPWEKGTDLTSAHRRHDLATEVTSMGLEHLATPDTIQKLARIDSEHLLLAIGTVKLQQARVRNKIGDFGGDDLATKKQVNAGDVPDGFAKSGGKGNIEALRRQLESIQSETTDSFIKKTKLQDEADQKALVSKGLADDLKKMASADDLKRQAESKRSALKNIDAEQSKLAIAYDETAQARSAAKKELRQVTKDLEELAKKPKAPVVKKIASKPASDADTLEGMKAEFKSLSQKALMGGEGAKEAADKASALKKKIEAWEANGGKAPITTVKVEDPTTVKTFDEVMAKGMDDFMEKWKQIAKAAPQGEAVDVLIKMKQGATEAEALEQVFGKIKLEKGVKQAKVTDLEPWVQETLKGMWELPLAQVKALAQMDGVVGQSKAQIIQALADKYTDQLTKSWAKKAENDAKLRARLKKHEEFDATGEAIPSPADVEVDDTSVIPAGIDRAGKDVASQVKPGPGRLLKKTTGEVADLDPIAMKYSRKDWAKIQEDLRSWIAEGYTGQRGAQIAQAYEANAKLGHLKDAYFDFDDRAELKQRQFASRANRVEDFLSRAPKHDGAIHRGVNLKDFATVKAVIEAYQRGEASFTMESWSMDKDIAQRFSSGEKGTQIGSIPGRHELILTVKKNKHGVNIDEFNTNEELEVLVPRGVRYDIEKVTTRKADGATYTEVILTQRDIDAAPEAPKKANKRQGDGINSNGDLELKGRVYAEGPTLAGSTAPKLYQDENGKAFVVKKGGAEGQNVAENTAQKVYKVLEIKDVSGVESQLVGDLLVNKFIPGAKPIGSMADDALKSLNIAEKVRQGHMADALLGNWDYVGLNGDNILTSYGGIYKIDAGGTFNFRAQGEKKAFGAVPDEVFSLRKQQGQPYWRNAGDESLGDLWSRQTGEVARKQKALEAAVNGSDLPSEVKRNFARRVDVLRAADSVVNQSSYSGRKLQQLVDDGILTWKQVDDAMAGVFESLGKKKADEVTFTTSKQMMETTLKGVVKFAEVAAEKRAKDEAKKPKKKSFTPEELDAEVDRITDAMSADEIDALLEDPNGMDRIVAQAKKKLQEG